MTKRDYNCYFKKKIIKVLLTKKFIQEKPKYMTFIGTRIQIAQKLKHSDYNFVVKDLLKFSTYS